MPDTERLVTPEAGRELRVRARSLERAGDLSGALAIHEQILADSEPGLARVPVLKQRAELMLRSEDPDGAARSLREAADLLREAGLDSAALALLERLGDVGGDADADLDAAELAISIGYPREASERLRRALQGAAPADTRVLAVLERAVEAAPRDRELRGELVDRLRAAGREEDADRVEREEAPARRADAEPEPPSADARLEPDDGEATPPAGDPSIGLVPTALADPDTALPSEDVDEGSLLEGLETTSLAAPEPTAAGAEQPPPAPTPRLDEWADGPSVSAAEAAEPGEPEHDDAAEAPEHDDGEALPLLGSAATEADPAANETAPGGESVDDPMHPSTIPSAEALDDFDAADAGADEEAEPAADEPVAARREGAAYGHALPLLERSGAGADEAGPTLADRWTEAIAEAERGGDTQRMREVIGRAILAYIEEQRFADAARAIQRLDEMGGADLDRLREGVEYAARGDDRSLLLRAYLALARGMARTGEADKARAVYATILEVDPGNAEARAALDRAGGVKLGALILDDETEALRTRFVMAADRLGGDEGEEFAAMVRTLRERVAEHVDASDSRTHFDLGIAFKEMGLLDQAIEQLQAAVRAGVELLAALEVLGECFVEKRQPDTAMQVLTRASRLPDASDESLAGVRYWMARAEEERGNPDAARTLYDAVIAYDAAFRDAARRRERLAGRQGSL